MSSSTETSFPITVFSFGYKYDPPQDVNLLVDVRFLNNPFYDEKLRSFTGLEACISDYVLNNDAGQQCLQHLQGMAEFLAEQFKLSDKEELRIAIGCTGGHHRSVAIAEALTKLLSSDFERVTCFHRDIKNESY
ncbi:MAG TPA: hypothetical protein EYH19_03975 [Desulfocapsa sulfexigens]|nr:hypothetical protein [Desulfocapsa sulfexigens]